MTDTANEGRMSSSTEIKLERKFSRETKSFCGAKIGQSGCGWAFAMKSESFASDSLEWRLDRMVRAVRASPSTEPRLCVPSRTPICDEKR